MDVPACVAHHSLRLHPRTENILRSAGDPDAALTGGDPGRIGARRDHGLQALLTGMRVLGGPGRLVLLVRGIVLPSRRGVAGPVLHAAVAELARGFQHIGHFPRLRIIEVDPVDRLSVGLALDGNGERAASGDRPCRDRLPGRPGQAPEHLLALRVADADGLRRLAGQCRIAEGLADADGDGIARHCGVARIGHLHTNPLLPIAIVSEVERFLPGRLREGAVGNRKEKDASK